MLVNWSKSKKNISHEKEEIRRNFSDGGNKVKKIRSVESFKLFQKKIDILVGKAETSFQEPVDIGLISRKLKFFLVFD